MRSEALERFLLGQAVGGRVPKGERQDSRILICSSRETNMKVRQAIPITSELGDISQLAKFDGE